MPGFSLTLFRGRNTPPMPAARNTPSTAINPPGVPEDLPKKIEADYLCAKKAKPFVVAFERANRAGSPYFIEAIRYGHAAEGPAAETAAAFLNVPAARLNFQRFQCPHCRSANFVRCGTCGRLVCQGRTKDGIFRCADDCGAEGRIEGALEAIGGQENMRAPGAMLPGPTATKLLSASHHHPTGGALPKRGG
jgi:hypothetical protein